jgi:inosose dehydratase
MHMRYACLMDPPSWSLKLANAPVSWGVDYPDDPKNPSWPFVLSQIGAAGFTYTELGPYGYLPPDPSFLAQELRRRNLSVIAGFVFQPLHQPDLEQHILAIANKTCALLSAVEARYLVLIDHISPERMQTAGDRSAALPLDPARFRFMVNLIKRLAGVALKHGIMPVLHQHAGSYIEFEDELENVLTEVAPEQVGVCIDTGHMAYAGIDAVAFYQRHHHRTKYFHFKDIDRHMHQQVLKGKVPFLDAVSQKIFCSLGKGVTDWRALRTALCEHQFAGYATIEQDIDPTISSDPLADALASLEFLRSVGF